jgi:hypothetical protein
MVTIEFPRGWTNAAKLEKILLASPGPHNCPEVTFGFPESLAIRVRDHGLSECSRKNFTIRSEVLGGYSWPPA